ncbi:MAG: hypothetical protein SNI51_07445 [Rikenellaceae bacterium]
MEKKITLGGVLTEGLNIGIKNVVPLILAYLLWVVTIWIPYINVGTTIAIATIPIELSKGKVINPTFIFDAKYRQFMGEFFILAGVMGIAIFIASWFFFIPAIVIGIAWSLAFYILLDKKISPMEAIMLSNKATYGYKLTIFLINLILGIAIMIACGILVMIPFLGPILVLCCCILAAAVSSSCSAVIYRELIG